MVLTISQGRLTLTDDPARGWGCRVGMMGDREERLCDRANCVRDGVGFSLTL